MQNEEPSTLERIHELTRAIIQTQGASAVSMRRIAKEVGITPMAIYHYYPSREELLNSVVDGEFQELLNFVERRKSKIADVSPSGESLAFVVMSYVDYAIARPNLFRYVFSESRQGARTFPDDYRAETSPTLTPLSRAVRQLMDCKALKEDDNFEVTLTLTALLHGLIELYLGGRIQLGEDQFRSLCERSLRRLLDGIAL